VPTSDPSSLLAPSCPGFELCCANTGVGAAVRPGQGMKWDKKIKVRRWLFF